MSCWGLPASFSSRKALEFVFGTESLAAVFVIRYVEETSQCAVENGMSCEFTQFPRREGARWPSPLPLPAPVFAGRGTGGAQGGGLGFSPAKGSCSPADFHIHKQTNKVLLPGASQDGLLKRQNDLGLRRVCGLDRRVSGLRTSPSASNHYHKCMFCSFNLPDCPLSLQSENKHSWAL